MLPRVVLHNAVSVDGRIDAFPADIGVYYELAGRWPAEVILTGADTILAAPEMDAEMAETGEAEAAAAGPADPNDPRPLLAITDSRGRLRCWSFLRHQPYWRDAVALVSHATPAEYLDYLAQQGVETIVAGEAQVDLRAALETLAERHGARLVRLDSGGALNGAALRAGLVDEVSVLVHPYLVGSGASPRSIFRAPDLGTDEEAIPLELTHVEQLGELVWLRYGVKG